MPGILRIVVVLNKTNVKLNKVSETLVNFLPRLGNQTTKNMYSVKCMDVREPPQLCDICIHLEEPYAVWFSWAKVNCMFVNMWNEAWNGYLDSFDIGVCVGNQTGFRNSITVNWMEFCNEREPAIVELFQLSEECITGQRDSAAPMPPLLLPEDCPPISVITLVHNRPKFIENACLNLLSTDYPKEKIEWIVVDDSEADKSPSNRIIQFQEQFPGTITYIPLIKKMPIGAKRNLAVDRSKNGILLMMDDDDHYPTTSFRRRVAYLLKGRRQYECAVCTTIAMYDLQTGISAVNVPPYSLSFGQRCSEATFTFTKHFWNQRKFDTVDMAEGEAFLAGRESQVVEMPPQQIIVAMSHGTNTSRRKTPEGNPGCFWGFPKELLEFLHGLVGIKVEAE